MKINILAAALALPDRELLARIDALAGNEREATAQLVAHLAALEMLPSLYLAEGYGSLFDYCTRALHLSEDAACNRIEAARASRRFPVILEMLAEGALTLTSVRKLKSHLTSENHEVILRKAAGRTKEQLEALIAALAPKPDVPAMVRKLPGTTGVVAATPETPALPTLLDVASEPASPVGVTGAPAEGSSAVEAHRDAGTRDLQGSPQPVPKTTKPVVQALAPERYRVQFTMSQETHDRLRRVQALLRRQIRAATRRRSSTALFACSRRSREGSRALPRSLVGVDRKRPGITKIESVLERIRPTIDPVMSPPPSNAPSGSATPGNARLFPSKVADARSGASWSSTTSIRMRCRVQLRSETSPSGADDTTSTKASSSSGRGRRSRQDRRRERRRNTTPLGVRQDRRRALCGRSVATCAPSTTSR